ncbi:hypothetical protein TNCV_78801 [Trichonephila clavipes]|nr:hypothetical protein TNCV_78801 [Trichonephila clavipes]
MRNRGRCKNFAKELISAEGLASTKKRAVDEGVGSKRRTTASASIQNAPYICPVCGTNYYDECQGQACVQCCDCGSFWFHEECVELEGDFICFNECSV